MYVIYHSCLLGCCLVFRPGVVLLSYQNLKDVDEEFRVSFVRHEVKKMYLDKDDGHCYLVAHCTVEECDTQQSDLGDNPSEFPLGKPHQELEVCQIESYHPNHHT